MEVKSKSSLNLTSGRHTAQRSSLDLHGIQLFQPWTWTRMGRAPCLQGPRQGRVEKVAQPMGSSQSSLCDVFSSSWTCQAVVRAAGGCTAHPATGTLVHKAACSTCKHTNESGTKAPAQEVVIVRKTQAVTKMPSTPNIERNRTVNFLCQFAWAKGCPDCW